MLRIRTFIVIVFFLGPMMESLGGFNVVIVPPVCPAFVADLRRSRTHSSHREGIARQKRQRSRPASVYQCIVDEIDCFQLSFFVCVCKLVCVGLCVYAHVYVCVCVRTQEGVLNSVRETDT